MGLPLVISLVGLSLFVSQLRLALLMHLIGLIGLMGMRQVIDSEKGVLLHTLITDHLIILSRRRVAQVLSHTYGGKEGVERGREGSDA